MPDLCKVAPIIEKKNASRERYTHAQKQCEEGLKFPLFFFFFLLFWNLKDIGPHRFLFNFKFPEKNYILDITLIYRKLLSSAKCINCDSYLQ